VQIRNGRCLAALQEVFLVRIIPGHDREVDIVLERQRRDMAGVAAVDPVGSLTSRADQRGDLGRSAQGQRQAAWQAEGMTTRLDGIGIWNFILRHGEPAEIAAAAAEYEQLGYSALWIPDVGGDVFAALDHLLASTTTATIATGILNLWMHTATETAERHAAFTQQYGDRFLCGIGVSHQLLIDGTFEAGRYRTPLAATRTFLDELDTQPTPLAPSNRVLAALGPKMLELAATRAAGAHPYLVTPEHTATAREALGAGPLLAPEQAVALTTDASEARALARAHLTMYLQLDNYKNNWRRLGYGDDDFANGGSDRLVDALVAWGDEDAVATRIQAHRDAGADHVCLQMLHSSDPYAMDSARRLAAALI
jgi:probable F420-dependent oxidoreductase